MGIAAPLVGIFLVQRRHRGDGVLFGVPCYLLLAALTAITVVVSMRVVGLLLINALMIVPNAAGQQVARSFRTVTIWAV